MSTPGSYTHFKSGESPVDLFQGTLEKFAAAHSAAKFFSIFFSSALRGTAWPLHFKFASYANESTVYNILASFSDFTNPPVQYSIYVENRLY